MKYLKRSLNWLVPVMLMGIMACCSLKGKAQLTGIKTVGAGKNYATVADAIAALNVNGVGAGGVTFNVSSGHNETFATATAGTITATGTAANPIVFRKTGAVGAGTNPKLKPAPGTGTVDAVIKIVGGDYITFDGIDVLAQGNNLGVTLMTEWGYAVIKASATNGSRNITIKNCTITGMTSPDAATSGIYVANHNNTNTTALNVTTLNGTNSGLKLYNNVLDNWFHGINISGASSFYDQDLDIGSEAGNEILDIGIASLNLDAYGIRVKYQDGVWIENNRFYSPSGNYCKSLAGISVTECSDTVFVLRNNIDDLFHRLKLNAIELHSSSIQVCSLNTIIALHGRNISGISVSGGETFIHRNKLSGFRFPLAEQPNEHNAFVNGITVMSGKTTIANNLIGVITAWYSSRTDAVNALQIDSQEHMVKLYHNTVYLDCSSGKSTFGSNIIRLNEHTQTDIRNNIFINNSSFGAVRIIKRTATDLTNFLSTSSNNILYAGVPSSNNLIYTDGTNNLQSLKDYQDHVTPRDSLASSFLPIFLSFDSTSAEFLKLDHGVETLLESGGGMIPEITGDYFDDSARASYPLSGQINGFGIAPDIGALEFDGKRDEIAPVISFTPPTGVHTVNTYVLGNVQITDNSGLSSRYKPRLYFRKSTDASEINDNTNTTAGWKYTEAEGVESPYQFTFDFTLLNGGATFNDSIQYFIVAQDQCAVANVALSSGTFSTTPADINLVTAELPSAITGSFAITLPDTTVIDSGGIFTTLAEAIATLNNIGPPEGGIVIQVPAGHTETFLSPLAGTITATGTVSKPVVFERTGEGNNPLITAATGTGTLDAVITVTGGDYLTFNGIDVQENGSNADNTQRMEYGYAILKTANNGAKNITIKNCAVTLHKINPATVGIYVANHTNLSAAAVLLTSVAGVHEDVTLNANMISNVYQGITVNAGSAPAVTYYDNRLAITNNTITDFGGSTTTNSGIAINGTDSVKVEYNTIHTSAGGAGTCNGIRSGGSVSGLQELGHNRIYGLSSGSAAFGIDIDGSATTHAGFNKIYDISVTGVGTIRGIRQTGSGTTVIHNNLIHSLNAQAATGGSAVSAVFVDGGTSVSVYHNTVLLSCTSSGSATFGSNAMFAAAGIPLTMKNNIFINLSTAGTARAFRRSNTSLANYQAGSDYNLYYAGTPSTTHVIYTDGTNTDQTLAAFKTRMSTRDQNSISEHTTFISADSLRPEAGFFRPGIAVSGFTTDYLGFTRSVPPDLGAFESPKSKWTGMLSTDMYTAGNWDGGVLPHHGSDLVIAPGAVYSPVLTTDYAVGCLTVPTGKSVSLNGYKLTITGPVSGAGVITGSALSDLVINGAGNAGSLFFDQATPGVTNMLRNFTLNRGTSTGTGSVTLANALVVKGTVTLTNGILHTDHNLKLLSVLSGTGRIGPIAATADITGNVTIERYMVGGAVSQRGWRTMSAPVTGFSYSQLADDILISGPGGASNGFDMTGYPSSILHYQESTTGDRGWKNITSINTAQDAGKGSIVFYRGDRTQVSSLTDPTVVPNSSTMDFYGEVNKGSIGPLALSYTNTLSPADDGWNLMGNPYPCEIDYSLVNKTANVSNTYWVINPNTKNYVNRLASEHIAISQGFFVQVDAAGQTISFEEADKVITGPTAYFKTSVNPFALKMHKDSVQYDIAWLEFANGASRDYIFNEDALKRPNNEYNMGFISTSGRLMQRNKTPDLLQHTSDTFVLSVHSWTNGNYRLAFENISALPAAKNVFIYDRFNSNWIDVRAGQEYVFAISTGDTNTTGKRFLLILTDEYNPLPVSWISFTGTREQHHALLKWQTADEKNSSHFVVECAGHNENFQSAGIVKSKGNSDAVVSYTFTDENVFTTHQMLYYRIRQVDLNGNSSLSNTIVIGSNEPATHGLLLYPNPATDVTTIEHGTEEVVDVRMFDAHGVEMSVQRQADEINTSQLDPGIYLVHIRTGSGTSVLKLIKQ